MKLMHKEKYYMCPDNKYEAIVSQYGNSTNGTHLTNLCCN